VVLGEIVIIPNHVHAIVIINHRRIALMQSVDIPSVNTLPDNTLFVDTYPVDTLHATYLRDTTMPNITSRDPTSRDVTTHSPKNKKHMQFHQKTGIDLPFANGSALF
jgi:hypothetical protein